MLRKSKSEVNVHCQTSEWEDGVGWGGVGLGGGGSHLRDSDRDMDDGPIWDGLRISEIADPLGFSGV